MQRDPDKESVQPQQETPQQKAPPRSFITFSILDLSGAVGSAQLQRIADRLKAFWNSLRKGKSVIRGVA
jgi:hypothetical protein